MMRTTITIDKAGRLVLPKQMREALHLKPGSSLEVEQRDDEVVLRPPQPEVEIVYKNGFPVIRSRSAVLVGTPIPELIEQDREERIQELIRRSMGVQDEVPGA